MLVYAIKNIPVATKVELFIIKRFKIFFLNLNNKIKGSDLEDIIKQSLISQLENVQIDDDEVKEVIEKHQLDSLSAYTQRQQEAIETENETEDQLAKLDAFNANLEKIKNANKELLDGKKTLNVVKGKNNQNDSSDSDD